tara:strand:+ start:453 stop:1409 length:957 start_codon:yes stop_codon:yes gene_type:complete
MAEVSIIIPMHNATDYIEECLSGISRQSKKNIEIILVDDGSTDDTVQKAEKYGFRIVMLKNGGNPSKARNFGSKKASGNIFIFVDSDIVLKPDSIERIVSKFSRRGVISVSGVYTKETPAAGFFSQLQNLILCYRLSKLPEIVTFTNSAFCAIKRDAFETIHGYNEGMSYFEDVEIGNRLTRNGYKLRIDSSLSVTHLKNFNHWSLICDYFKKAAVSGMYKHKNFFKNKKSDELLWYIKISGVSTVLVFFSVFLIGISVIPLLVSLVVYSLSLSPLLFFLIKTKGLLFGLISYFVCFELFLVSFVAIICGIIGVRKSS